jgi:iron complex transport system substrate-binding protein
MKRDFWIPSFLAMMVATSLQAVGSFPVTVVDDRCLEITIEGEPARIVAVGALYAQILVDLGVTDRLVAVAESDDNPPEVAPLPTVGIAFAPSVETILAFDPDLVLGPTDYGGERPALEAAGVTVLSTPWITDISSIFDMVRTVGAAVGEALAADLLVGRIAEEILEAELEVLGLEAIPAAFLYASSPTDPPYAAGSDAIEHELIVRAGGTNVFSELQWSPQVAFEEIIARDPDVVFTAPSQVENVLENPFLQTVTAVTEGRVYGIEASLVTSTRVAEAFRLILEGLRGADS